MNERVLMESTQELRNAFYHAEFLNEFIHLSYEDNQLFGSIYSYGYERDEMLKLISKQNIYRDRYAHSVERAVFLVPNQFKFTSKGKKPFSFAQQIGYSHDFGPSESTPDEFEDVEEFSSVFVAKKAHEAIGFFAFKLRLDGDQSEKTLYLHLEQIYVEKEHRNTTVWMDLTIALTKFINILLESIMKTPSKLRPMDVVIFADYAEKIGETIARSIVAEVTEYLEYLVDVHPETKERVGQVICDMGY